MDVERKGVFGRGVEKGGMEEGKKGVNGSGGSGFVRNRFISRGLDILLCCVCQVLYGKFCM